MDNNKNFKTNSFYLAAFLLAKNIDLASVEKTAFSKTVFIFHNSDELQKLIGIFNFSKENDPILLVNFKRVEASIKRLKSLIYD